MKRGHKSCHSSSASRLGRVLQIFSPDIFKPAKHVRGTFLLPECLINRDQDGNNAELMDRLNQCLSSGKMPYTKLVHVLNLPFLMQKYQQTVDTIATGEEHHEDLCPVTLMEAVMKVCSLLNLITPGCSSPSAISSEEWAAVCSNVQFGVALIDFVAAGRHSRDTCFFLLYRVVSASSAPVPESCSLPHYTKVFDALLAEAFRGEDSKNTEWFVCAVLDADLSTSRILGKELSIEAELEETKRPFYHIVADYDINRLVVEYERYLMREDAPPRNSKNRSIAQQLRRRREKLSSITGQQSPVGTKSPASASDVEESEDRVTSPTEGSIDDSLITPPLKTVRTEAPVVVPPLMMPLISTVPNTPPPMPANAFPSLLPKVVPLNAIVSPVIFSPVMSKFCPFLQPDGTMLSLQPFPATAATSAATATKQNDQLQQLQQLVLSCTPNTASSISQP